MSISRAQRARLGVFVIAGIILLAIFFVIPLGMKLTDKFNTFFAYFEGESLSGLEQGAVVKFSGVPIGKVEKITYLPDNLSKVKVEMKIQHDFPMKVDMVATTGAMGITGLKYVEITGGKNESELLKPGSEIPTKISVISTITGKAESIVAKVELLLNHLNQITEPDSLRSIKKILDNVAYITEDVRGFVSESRPQIQKMTSSTSSLITKIDSVAGDIKNFTSSFKGDITADQISRTFSAIDSTVQSLKSLAENLSLMVRQSREDFAVGMENIREASENANQLTKILAENPSLLLKGESQRGREVR
ncbi:MAG TPA: MlaD family protein [Chitinispirillaceae bacterium]|jgi:ABC-type transporter Mla subunit MlaD|nr:MlaD family protein [Chitinispirillaceae bacterium]